jgi:putative metallohydrolase (TIGR04338 family)
MIKKRLRSTAPTKAHGQDEDPQRYRVYEAENIVFPSSLGRRFRTCGEIADWLTYIFTTRWFRNHHRLYHRFEIHDGRGDHMARGWSDDDFVCHLSIIRALRCELFVLHELAHALTFGGHGPEFCSTYLKLVRRFIGREAFENLRFTFRANDVKYRHPPTRIHEKWAYENLEWWPVAAKPW